jgi:hypothetical protein
MLELLLSKNKIIRRTLPKEITKKIPNCSTQLLNKNPFISLSTDVFSGSSDK